MGKPKFNPDAKYESVVTTEKPVFDPNKPFETENGTVKKKETPLPQNFSQGNDLQTGMPLSQNGAPNTSTSKLNSVSESENGNNIKVPSFGTNPILNYKKPNPQTSFQEAKSFIDSDYDRNHAAQMPFLNLVEPIDNFESFHKAGVPIPQNLDINAYNKKVLAENPDALKKYRQQREADANGKIDVIKEQGFFHPIVANPTADIQELEDYKNTLRKNVSDIAKIAIPQEFLAKGTPFEIQDVGKKYLEVTGDPLIGDDEKVLQSFNKHPNDPSAKKQFLNENFSEDVALRRGTHQENVDRTKQKIQYKLYSTGASVLSDYYADASDKLFEDAKPKIETLTALFQKQEETKDPAEKNTYQKQIDIYLADPAIKNAIDATRQAIDYSVKAQNAPEQFPQVQRQINRQKLNDAFFVLNGVNENFVSGIPNTGFGLNALHWLFGATPAKEQIPLIAQMAGVSQDEAKKIYDEKVKGFIGEAPTGIRVDGLLQGLAKGTDETLAKSLMGLRRFFDTDNVETKNRLLNDRLVDYHLEAQKNKLKDDFGKYNINPFSIFNTMGNGIGQTAVYGLPALATGGLAAEGSALQKLIEGSSTVASGYAGSYEDSYKEASRYTDDEKLRRAYANVTAYENALPELLLSPAQVLKKVGIGTKAGRDAFETFAKEATEKGINETVKQRVLKFSKELGNVVGAENIEELATLVSNTTTKKSQLGIDTSPAEFINQAIETAVQTTITTLPLGVGAGINANNDMSGIRKEALFEAGNEPELYKDRLKVLLDNGSLNQHEYNGKVSLINTMQNIVPKVNQTTKADGKPLTYTEKADLAAQDFRILNNNNLKKNGVLAAQESQIEHDNADALERSNAILFGKNQTQPYYAIVDADGKHQEIAREEAVKLLNSKKSEGLLIAYDETLQKELEAQGGASKTSVKIPVVKNPSGTPEEISQPIELNPNITGNITTEPQISENGKGNNETDAKAQTDKGQEITQTGAAVNVAPLNPVINEEEIKPEIIQPEGDENITGSNEINKKLENEKKNVPNEIGSNTGNNSGVSKLVNDETKMSESEQQKIQVLRRERDNRIGELEKQLRAISERYGGKTDPKTFNREDRQQWELLQRELQVGIAERAASESQSNSESSISGQDNTITGISGENGNIEPIDTKQDGIRNDSGRSDKETDNRDGGISGEDNKIIGTVSNNENSDKNIAEKNKDVRNTTSGSNANIQKSESHENISKTNVNSVSGEALGGEDLKSGTPIKDEYGKRFENLDKENKQTDISNLSEGDYVNVPKTDKSSGVQGFVKKVGRANVVLDTFYQLGSTADDGIMQEITVKKADIKEFVKPKIEEKTSQVTDNQTDQPQNITPETTEAENKSLADKIRSLRPKKTGNINTTIFALPIAIYDTAIVTIANAVEKSGDIAKAIQKGYDYIKTQIENWEDKDGKFAQHINDALEGKKPRVTVQTEEDDSGNTPPPNDTTGTTTSDDEPVILMRKTFENVINRSTALTSKQKELFKNDPVAFYTQLPVAKVRAITDKLIDEVGIDKAVIMAGDTSNDLTPVERNMLLGSAVNYYAKEGKKAELAGKINGAKEFADKELEAHDKMLDAMDKLAKASTAYGQAINIIKEIYKLSGLALERKIAKIIAQVNKANAPLHAENVSDIKDVLQTDNEQTIKDAAEALTQEYAQAVNDAKAEVAQLQKELAELKKASNAKTNTGAKGSNTNPLKIKRITNATGYAERLKSLKSRTRSGISSEDLSDLVYIGTFHVENGLTKFGDWVGAMVRSVGKKFMPHLRDTYDKIKEETIAKGVDEKLFDNDTTIDDFIENQANESTAKKIAQKTKQILSAQQRKAEGNDPDAARKKAPELAAKRIRQDAAVNLDLVETKNEQTYLKKLVKIIHDKAKEHYTATKQKLSNVNDLLSFAIANRKADPEIWDNTKAEVEKQIDADETLSDTEKDEVKDFLEDYTNSIFDTLLTDNQRRKIVNEKLIEAGYVTEKTVKGKVVKTVDWNKITANAKNNKEAKKAIVKAVTDLGFTEAEAQKEINYLLDWFDSKVADIKTIATNNILKRGVLNKVKNTLSPYSRKAKVQKLMALDEQGLLTDDKIKEVLSKELGVVTLTDADITKLRDLNDKANNDRIPYYIRKRFEEQINYFLESKSANFKYKENKEFLLNSMLATIWNNVQNISGWARIISKYIEVSVKTGSPKEAFRVMKKSFRKSVYNALTILINAEVSRGTAYSDITQTSEGEARVRMLEYGNPKLLGIPDFYVSVGGRKVNLNFLNTGYKNTKYAGRILESADTVPSEIISNLEQYYQMNKLIKKYHPEYSQAKLQSEVRSSMSPMKYGVATIKAIRGLKEAGVKINKQRVIRAADEFVERERNNILAKEFEQYIESIKPQAKIRLEARGIADPTDEQILKETYLIAGSDQPLDVVARGERQALVETGKKTTGGITYILMYVPNAVSDSIRKALHNPELSKTGKLLAKVPDYALTTLLPFANGAAKWVEMGLELTPYGILKAASYKAQSWGAKARDETEKANLYNELAANMTIRTIQGITQTMLAFYLLGLLHGSDDDEDEDENVIQGKYPGDLAYSQKRVQQAQLPENTLIVGGHKIPIDILGNTGIPMMMYADYLNNKEHRDEEKAVGFISGITYMVNAASATYTNRLGAYGDIWKAIASGDSDRILPQVGRVLGNIAFTQLNPFNRLQREVANIFNPETDAPVKFGSALMQQLSIVGSLDNKRPSFDYMGNILNNDDIYGTNVNGIIDMFGKYKKGNKTGKEGDLLSSINWGYTDAFKEVRDQDGYKYSIKNEDGSSRGFGDEEYYDFKFETATRFGAKIRGNMTVLDEDRNQKVISVYDFINNANVPLSYDKDRKPVGTDVEKTIELKKQLATQLLGDAKEEALDVIQAKTGYTFNRLVEEKMEEAENKPASKIGSAYKKQLKYGIQK